MNILLFLAANTLAVYLVDQLLEGFVVQDGWLAYLIVGAVFALFNTFLKPILKVLSLPFIFLTAGLFVLVVNAGVLWVTESFISWLDLASVSLTITGAGTYIAAVLGLGILNYVFQKVLR